MVLDAGDCLRVQFVCVGNQWIEADPIGISFAYDANNKKTVCWMCGPEQEFRVPLEFVQGVKLLLSPKGPDAR